VIVSRDVIVYILVLRVCEAVASQEEEYSPLGQQRAPLGGQQGRPSWRLYIEI
jgi:hypothetical protein